MADGSNVAPPAWLSDGRRRKRVLVPRPPQAPAVKSPWSRMATLIHVGEPVWLRLALGPTRVRLGAVVKGFMGRTTDGPIYYSWDRTSRSHVAVRPVAWSAIVDPRQPPEAA